MSVDNDRVRNEQAPDAATLMQISTAYWESQTLLTANRIGLFAVLADGPLGTERIARALGTALRPTRLLLHACVALGLLEQSDEGFRNSRLSSDCLVPGGDRFLGDAIRYADDLYTSWGRLEESLREGKPVLATELYTGESAERTRHFVYGMHNRALAVGQVLTHLVDLTGRRRMLDIGGGPGTYSVLFVRRYPGLRATLMDLPAVVEIAGEIIAAMGAADAVTRVAGDYLTDRFPAEQDVVLISGVFHRETEENCRKLIDAARACLCPGGMLVISDVFTDGSGVSPRFATLFGLNMLLSAADGGVHADMDVVKWLADAGFIGAQSRCFPPPMPHRVIQG